MNYGVFGGCKNLRNIELSNNITDIKKFLFWNCTSLERIIIPQKVASIGYEAFHGCCSLKEIVILEDKKSSEKSICEYAFSDCSSLERITIPESVVTIPPNAFVACSNLKSVTWGSDSYTIMKCQYFPELVKMVYVVEKDNLFAKGDTLRDAITDLQNKISKKNKAADTILSIM